jgi:hypothetical protein
MTTPTYGHPVVEPGGIVARIDALIPRDETHAVPLVWRARNIDLQVLIDARLEILSLRSQLDATYVAMRVRMLEEALADERAISRRLAEANDDLRARLRASETEIERLRNTLTDAVSLIERLIDTRRCSAADLRTLNAARAALEAKP